MHSSFYFKCWQVDVFDWFELDLPSDLIYPQEERTNEQKNCQTGGDMKTKPLVICKLVLSWATESVFSFSSCFEKVCCWRTLCKPIFWKQSDMFHAVVSRWGELKQNKTNKNPCFPPIFLLFCKVTWTSFSFSIKWKSIDSRGRVNRCRQNSIQNSLKFDVFTFEDSVWNLYIWGRIDKKYVASLKWGKLF